MRAACDRPSITEPSLFCVAGLDLEPVFDELGRFGATSRRVLGEDFRQRLLTEAEQCRYREAREVIGRGQNQVRQRMGVFDAFDPTSAFLELKRAFQSLWDGSLGRLPASPFERRPIFNDLMLQRYTPGKEGITPHRDRTAYRYIICLFVIEGYGRFGICEDRSGSGAREIPHGPGDVILTRAPGFRGSDERPFHFVEDIRQTRYVFGLRHDESRIR